MSKVVFVGCHGGTKACIGLPGADDIGGVAGGGGQVGFDSCGFVSGMMSNCMIIHDDFGFIGIQVS